MAEYTYSVTITEAEQKAFLYVAVDPQEWVSNLVHNRCRMAMEEIVAAETTRMLADPTVTAIPADKEKIVLDADIPTAREMHERTLADSTKPII